MKLDDRRYLITVHLISLSFVCALYSLSITEPDASNAEGVYQAIMDKCNMINLDLTGGLTAAAADGAAVNFSKTKGVLTKLQDSMPWMLKVHCLAHRLWSYA